MCEYIKVKEGCSVVGVATGHIGCVRGISGGRLCARFVPMTE